MMRKERTKSNTLINTRRKEREHSQGHIQGGRSCWLFSSSLSPPLPPPHFPFSCSFFHSHHFLSVPFELHTFIPRTSYELALWFFNMWMCVAGSWESRKAQGFFTSMNFLLSSYSVLESIGKQATRTALCYRFVFFFCFSKQEKVDFDRLF